jgi:type 1 fimbria pilin
LLIAMNLFFVMSGACLAASPSSGGTIHFRGAIVDSSCTSRAGTNSTFGFNYCPSRLGGKVLTVQPVSTVTALDHSNVKIKPLSTSRPNGPLFDQQYALVDGKGNPVRSGVYLITLTLP